VSLRESEDSSTAYMRLLFFNLRCSLVLVVSLARPNDISIRGVVYFRSRVFVSSTCVSVPNSKIGVTQPIMHSPVIRGRLRAYALFDGISEKNRNFFFSRSVLPRNEKLLALYNTHSFYIYLVNNLFARFRVKL